MCRALVHEHRNVYPSDRVKVVYLKLGSENGAGFFRCDCFCSLNIYMHMCTAFILSIHQKNVIYWTCARRNLSTSYNSKRLTFHHCRINLKTLFLPIG